MKIPERLKEPKVVAGGAIALTIAAGMSAWGVEVYNDAKMRAQVGALAEPLPSAQPEATDGQYGPFYEAPLPSPRLRDLAASIIKRYEANPEDRNATSSPTTVSVRVPTSSAVTVVLEAQSESVAADGTPDPEQVKWVGMRQEYSDGSPATTVDVYASGGSNVNTYWANGDKHVAEVDGFPTGQVGQLDPAHQHDTLGGDIIEDRILTQAESLNNTIEQGYSPTLDPLLN